MIITLLDQIIVRKSTILNINKDTIIADIGAGTGIFSQMLLNTEAFVYSIEPNKDMFAILEERLKGYSRSKTICAVAENTMLLSKSIDVITVAQAFHWFSPIEFKTECIRILKNTGKIILLWNVHKNTPLLQDIEKCMRSFNSMFHGFNTGINFKAIKYCIPNVQKLIYPNELTYTQDTFKYRWLSSSFAPNSGTTEYDMFLQKVMNIFYKYNYNGTVKIENDTYIYIGSPFI